MEDGAVGLARLCRCAGGAAADSARREVICSARILLRRRWTSSNGGRCRRFTWSDILDGKLHRCAGLCTHWGVHAETPRCWDAALGNILNHGWGMASRHPQYVQKPRDLDLDDGLLETDIDTVMAFVLCTAPSWPLNLSQDQSTLDCTGLGGPGGFRLDFVEKRSHLIIHLQGQLSSKAEDFSITEDIVRCGWVVAAGLSEATPLSLYVPADGRSRGSILPSEAPMKRAVQRVLDVLKISILDRFPNDAGVLNAIHAIQYMISQSTGNDVHSYGAPGLRVAGGRKEQLTGRHCALAMQVFNDFRPLTDQEAAELAPVLGPVLNAAFMGAYEVVQYLKDHFDRELTLPAVFRNH